MPRALVIAGLCALLGASRADAHPAPFSYLDIVFTDEGIDGSLVIHLIDLAHDLGITPVDRLLDDARVQAERQRMFDLVASRMVLRAGNRLAPQWQSAELLREDTAIRLRYRIPGAVPGALTIDTDLFPYDPVHQTFVNIYEEDPALEATATVSRRPCGQQMIFSSPDVQVLTPAAQRRVPSRSSSVRALRHSPHPDSVPITSCSVGLLLLGGTGRRSVKIVTSVHDRHSSPLTRRATW